MAAAGLYTFGGSFWEFGEPDWPRTRYFLLFGVAEDHASNPIKIGLGELKNRGVKIVSINPVKTGYSAIADEWIGIRPGTDGLFVSESHPRIAEERTPSISTICSATPTRPGLSSTTPGAPAHGLFARDKSGNPLVTTDASAAMVAANKPEHPPALAGEVNLPDGRRAATVFELIARRFLDEVMRRRPLPSAAAVPAETISRIAAELAHAAFEQEVVLDVPWIDWPARAMKRPSAGPSPCTQCAASRPIRTASTLAGFSISCNLYWARSMCPAASAISRPYPRPIPPAIKPAGKPGQVRCQHASRRPSAWVLSPVLKIFLVEADGTPCRIDKAYSWEAPLAAHGLMHTVIANAAQARSIWNRRPASLHGEHELELGHECARHSSRSDRPR